MTELDVMNDLLFCQNGDCANCSRGNEENCKAALMRDARSVIKMQTEALSGVSDTINKLKEENQSLRKSLNCNYEKKKLVQNINDVIEAFGEDEYWDEDYQKGTLDLQVDALKKLLGLIGWDNCKIVIERGSDYPQIQYKE